MILLRILVRGEHLAAGAKPFIRDTVNLSSMEIARKEAEQGLLDYIKLKAVC